MKRAKAKRRRKRGRGEVFFPHVANCRPVYNLLSATHALTKYSSMGFSNGFEYFLWTSVALSACWMWSAVESNLPHCRGLSLLSPLPPLLDPCSAVTPPFDPCDSLRDCAEICARMAMASASNVGLPPGRICSFTLAVDLGAFIASLIPTQSVSNLPGPVLGTCWLQ
jgi:hypothetical protein